MYCYIFYTIHLHYVLVITALDVNTFTMKIVSPYQPYNPRKIPNDEFRNSFKNSFKEHMDNVVHVCQLFRLVFLNLPNLRNKPFHLFLTAAIYMHERSYVDYDWVKTNKSEVKLI